MILSFSGVASRGCCTISEITSKDDIRELCVYGIFFIKHILSDLKTIEVVIDLLRAKVTSIKKSEKGVDRVAKRCF